MLEYTAVREFLVDLKKKFGEGDNKENKSSRIEEGRTRE